MNMREWGWGKGETSAKNKRASREGGRKGVWPFWKLIQMRATIVVLTFGGSPVISYSISVLLSLSILQF